MTNLISQFDLSENQTNEIPDWARYHSQSELEQEAMDYEFNARYDDISERYGDQTDYGGQHDYDDEDEVFTCAAPEVYTVRPFGPEDIRAGWNDRNTQDDLPF